MRYISIEVRNNILQAYKAFYGYKTLNEELDRDLFGDPEMRKAIDEAYEAADIEIDRDRFTVFSDEWYRFLVSKLPPLKAKVIVPKNEVGPDHKNNLKVAAEKLLVAQKDFIFSLLKFLED